MDDASHGIQRELGRKKGRAAVRPNEEQVRGAVMTAPQRVTCKWCGKEFDYDAGYYYHRHECHARDVRRRLELNTIEYRDMVPTAESIERNNKERKALRAELEQAEYVGD